jgi:hypothetical protein
VSLPAPRMGAAGLDQRALPGHCATETTTAVVIGSGLPGLAVASELSRQGIASIVVAGRSELKAIASHCDFADPESLSERTSLLRLLRCYASSHRLDIRSDTVAETVRRAGQATVLPEPANSGRWAVYTGAGVLLADHVVLTRYPHNQLRRFLQSLGVAIRCDLKQALQAMGLYLVGAGEILEPTTREIVRQARLVSSSIAANPRASGYPASDSSAPGAGRDRRREPTARTTARTARTAIIPAMLQGTAP